MRRLVKVWRRLRVLERLAISATERQQLRDLTTIQRYLRGMEGRRGRLFEEHRDRLREQALALHTSLAMVEVRRVIGGDR